MEPDAGVGLDFLLSPMIHFVLGFSCRTRQEIVIHCMPVL
jgi:hypothetical protein